MFTDAPESMRPRERAAEVARLIALAIVRSAMPRAHQSTVTESSFRLGFLPAESVHGAPANDGAAE